MAALLSRRDLDFLLFDWLDAAGLCDRPRFVEHSRETFADALDLSAQLAAERFAPHYRRSDTDEPVLRDGRVRIVPEVKAAIASEIHAGLLRPHDQPG